MTRIPMKFIKAYQDRHGKWRYYFRKPGAASIALPGDPDTKAFREAYDAALDGAPRQIGVDRTKPGSFSALIALYYTTGAYRELADITRKTYRNDMERFRAKRGDMSVKALERKHVTAMLDAVVAQGKSPKSLRRVLGILLTLAHERGWRTDNPMVGMRRTGKASEGFRPWTEADIAKFEAHWPPGSRERLALALLLYTAQRRQDVVTMGRQHAKPGKVYVATHKSGGKTRLWIPMHANLRAEVDLVPPSQLTFILTQYGEPFSPAGFTNWFSEKAQEAGLPPRSSPHGLRKASLRRLAEAGCTPHQIMAVSGHKNLSEVTLYTASADQERLADEAIERTKVSTPPSPVRQSGQKM
jgi:integrase